MDMKVIFVVDDNSTNLISAESVLEKYYSVITLSSANKLFSALKKIKPDLILLDIRMPEMNGFETMMCLKSSPSYADIPVIFLTGLVDSKIEAQGIELGAVDFITKPFSEPVLLNRIRNHLNIEDMIHERTKELQLKTHQLIRLQNGIVYTLADLVESRDIATGGHIDRTSIYMRLLLNAMLEENLYVNEILTWNIETVISSSRLHDVGKILVPDSILNKPGKLTKDEFEIIKKHVITGQYMIDQMMVRTGDAEFLHTAKMFAGYHHEKWNGMGYPYGLKGQNIPLYGRIMAIIDVYDALTSERSYKKAYTSDMSMKMIIKDSGTHFDPKIVNIFANLKDKLATAKNDES